MLGLNLELSLSRQAAMVHHRQQAARMNRNELHHLADELIQRCHQQEHLIMELQRCAANLMVQMAINDAPIYGQVSDEHRQWAKDLLDIT